MKYLILVLALVSFSASAATVINFDDGSTLTLKEDEMIHVTKDLLYRRQSYNNGRTVQFKVYPETTNEIMLK